MPTSRSIARSSLAALTLAVPLAWSASASAQAACGDQTCPKNYECVVEPNACPDIACANDKDCPPCSGTTQYCSPLACATDADCADDMVCYKQTQEDCSSTAPPCEKGANCATPADSTCTSETVSACAPRYLLPCQADADCGVGFTCDEEQSCSCSGSAGSGSAGSASSSGGASSGSAGSPTPTPAPDGDAGSPKPAADGGAGDPVPPADGSTPDAGAPAPPDCSCQPSGTKACNLKIVACSVDQGCPAGWTCGANPNGTCSSGPNGSSCTADPAMICLPPYANLSLGGARHDGGLDTSGSGEASGTGGASSSTPPPSGTSSGTPSSGTPEAPGAADNGPKASSPASTSVETDAGCAVGHARSAGSGTFGFLALAFAGLIGLRRRRSN